MEIGGFPYGEMDSYDIFNHSVFSGGQETRTLSFHQSLLCLADNPEQCRHNDPTKEDALLRNYPQSYLSTFDHIQQNNRLFMPVNGVNQRDTTHKFVAANEIINQTACGKRRNDMGSSINANKRIRPPGDGVTEGHSSCSYISGEDNVPCMTNTSDEKTWAGRGGATDPQSLYARKRREKINERLKILQNLVPNGTKVDISTMLEEAVHYVKFLQLQIKLLSSDDLWMYAPLAYNGFHVSLHMEMFSQHSPR